MKCDLVYFSDYCEKVLIKNFNLFFKGMFGEMSFYCYIYFFI